VIRRRLIGVQDLQELPQHHCERIWHFFEHYKALEQGKWAKITGWGDKADAQRILGGSDRALQRKVPRRLSRPRASRVGKSATSPFQASRIAANPAISAALKRRAAALAPTGETR
jgi:hypothetical protein